MYFSDLQFVRINILFNYICQIIQVTDLIIKVLLELFLDPWGLYRCKCLSVCRSVGPPCWMRVGRFGFADVSQSNWNSVSVFVTYFFNDFLTNLTALLSLVRRGSAMCWSGVCAATPPPPPSLPKRIGSWPPSPLLCPGWGRGMEPQDLIPSPPPISLSPPPAPPSPHPPPEVETCSREAETVGPCHRTVPPPTEHSRSSPPVWRRTGGPGQTCHCILSSGNKVECMLCMLICYCVPALTV